MARKKITLAFIPNDAERKASFKKRKKGLIKKLSELNILCGVDACAVIYSPYDPQPVVWPSPEVARTLLKRFMNLPDLEKTKKMVNQEIFTRYQIKKAEERLRRLQKENKRKELEIFMYKVIEGKASMKDFDPRDTREMRYIINETLEEINLRMEALKKAGADGGEITPAAVAPPVIDGENVEGVSRINLMSPGGRGRGAAGGDGGRLPANSTATTPGSSTIRYV